MKRAVFKSIFTLLFSLSLVAAAQDKQQPVAAVAKESTSGKTQPKSAAKTKPENPNEANPKKPTATASPAAPPSVKLTDIKRLDDLNVEVQFDAANLPDNKDAGVLGTNAGFVSVEAQYDNGQVASNFTSFNRQERRKRLTLNPATPSNGNGNVAVAPVQENKKTDPTTGAPANGANSNGLNKENVALRSTRSQSNGAPRLVRVTAKITVTLRQGNNSVTLSDEQSRKF